MKSRIVVLSIATVVIAVGLGSWMGGWGDKRARPNLSPASSHEAEKPPPFISASISVAAPPPVAAVPPTPVLPPIAEVAAAPTIPVMKVANSTVNETAPEKPNLDLIAAAAIEIDQVGLMFRDYRTLMGSNPVGTNAEIILAVSGGNPKKALLGPPKGQQINGRGELVDTWGTAYFFHQKSATDMEIHSAGPDKQFGTSDDIIGR